MKKIFLSSPTMNGLEQKFIQDAFDSNWVAPLGKNVDEFENELAQYIGIGHATALSSGTAAIHLAVKLAGIERDDIVFCSDLTFCATVNPVSYENGRAVFIDCERNSWNMDPEALEKAINKYPNAKAVIVVNLYGTPAKLDEIKTICDKHNLILIEDAAESLGATINGIQTGNFGKYGIFSFNGNKIITTSGGGMLVSNNKSDIEKAKFWATQARDQAKHYQHSEIGYNYRMSNIVAGIGRGQMSSLNEFVQIKKNIYNTYKMGFADIPDISMNPFLDNTKPNFWLSCILLSKDSKVKPLNILEALEKENIESRPIWKPMHLQPVFEGYDYVSINFGKSVSEDIYNRGLCLPSDVKSTQEDLERVIQVVRKCFGK